MYKKAFKIPLKPYLAIIEDTENPKTKHLKKNSIIMIGSPIKDIPSNHIMIVKAILLVKLLIKELA